MMKKMERFPAQSVKTSLPVENSLILPKKVWSLNIICPAREFLNLKKSVVCHIKVYKSHKDALKEQEEREKEANDLKAKKH